MAFIKELISLMTTVEAILLALFVGSIALSLALLIILAYMISSGRVKAILFGIESENDKDIISDEGGKDE